MKALRMLKGLGLLEVPVPKAEQGQALVRVRMAGVCNTDVEIARGYMGFEGTLGHELLGTVEQASDARLVGKRVAAEINLACGRCPTCRRGLKRHCPERSVMGILSHDGCFAEFVTVPEANLHVIPDSLSDEHACFVEPLAAAFEITEQVELEPGTQAAVLGDGKLGLLCAQVLQLSGCRVTLVGRHARKLELASSWGIATCTPADLKARSMELVVEATGSSDGMAMAIAALQPRGTLVLKSTYHGPLTLDAAPLVIDEITLVGSRCGPFEPAIEALAGGHVEVGPLIDAIVPLDRGLDAFEQAQAPGVIKVLLDMRTGD